MIIWDEIVVQTPTSLFFFAVGCSTTVCGQLVLLTKVQSPTEDLIDASATVPGEEEEDERGEGGSSLDAAAEAEGQSALAVAEAADDARFSVPQESDCVVRRGDSGESSRLLKPPATQKLQQHLGASQPGTSSALLASPPARSLLSQLSASTGQWTQWLSSSDAHAGPPLIPELTHEGAAPPPQAAVTVLPVLPP